MTDKLTRDDLQYDYNALALAEVGKNFLKEGRDGFPLAQKSLELMLDDMNFSDPGITKTITDPAVIQRSIQNQLDVYNEIRKGETVDDILVYHKSAFNKYLGGATTSLARRARAELKEFRGQTLAEIELDVKNAKHTIEGYKLDRNTKAEKEGAEATIKSYANVRDTMVILRQDNISALTRRVEKAYTTDVFTEMYTPVEDSDDSE